MHASDIFKYLESYHAQKMIIFGTNINILTIKYLVKVGCLKKIANVVLKHLIVLNGQLIQTWQAERN